MVGSGKFCDRKFDALMHLTMASVFRPVRFSSRGTLLGFSLFLCLFIGVLVDELLMDEGVLGEE
jgi:hypothetical protein